MKKYGSEPVFNLDDALRISRRGVKYGFAFGYIIGFITGSFLTYLAMR